MLWGYTRRSNCRRRLCFAYRNGRAVAPLSGHWQYYSVPWGMRAAEHLLSMFSLKKNEYNPVMEKTCRVVDVGSNSTSRSEYTKIRSVVDDGSQGHVTQPCTHSCFRCTTSSLAHFDNRVDHFRSHSSLSVLSTQLISPCTSHSVFNFNRLL